MSIDDRSIELETLSVVIVTWRRPKFVSSCLKSLEPQAADLHQVIVVDASEDSQTELVVKGLPFATWIAFPEGAGHMTSARNEGLCHVTGAFVAFLDDDVEVRPGWAQALRSAFSDETVGAVAGRTCNNQPDEASEGVDQIGLLLERGRLTGNFAADPGRVVDVDHGIGANMAFRRSVLARLGGFRDDFPGTAMREDTDMFLRTKALGARAVFVPDASVDHRGAPHVRGKRFGWRYMFWSNHNHALLLSRNLGLAAPDFRRWVLDASRQSLRQEHPSRMRRIWRAGVQLSGIGAGLVASTRKAGLGPTDPHRTDQIGANLFSRLSSEPRA